MIKFQSCYTEIPTTMRSQRTLLYSGQ